MSNKKLEKKQNKQITWVVPVVSALILIVAAAAYILFKMGQECGAAEDKWKDYDDCGWS